MLKKMHDPKILKTLVFWTDKLTIVENWILKIIFYAKNFSIFTMRSLTNFVSSTLFSDSAKALYSYKPWM